MATRGVIPRGIDRRAPYLVIVDPDPDALEVCVGLFEAASFVAVGIESGLLARELIAIDPPAALVIDLSLPDLDAWTLISAMRRQVLTARTPIVALSTADDERTRAEAMAAGATRFVRKPYDPRQLVADVEGLVYQERDFDRRWRPREH